jgi:hypothetical protein
MRCSPRFGSVAAGMGSGAGLGAALRNGRWKTIIAAPDVYNDVDDSKY